MITMSFFVAFGGIIFLIFLILLVLFKLIFAFGHIIWQVYGNFIWFEWRGKTAENDKEY